MDKVAEYIDKAEVLKLVEKYSPINGCGEGHYSGVADCIGEEIEDIPPADVAPVIHARWELCYDDYRQQIAGDKCSACGFEHYGCGISHYHYCPNCGAKMDESEDE